jgi:hypothetical protein
MVSRFNLRRATPTMALYERDGFKPLLVTSLRLLGDA